MAFNIRKREQNIQPMQRTANIGMRQPMGGQQGISAQQPITGVQGQNTASGGASGMANPFRGMEGGSDYGGYKPWAGKTEGGDDYGGYKPWNNGSTAQSLGGMSGGTGATPQDAKQFSPYGGGQKDRYAGWDIVNIGKGSTPPGYTVGSLNDRGNMGGGRQMQDYSSMLPSPNPGGQEPDRISMQQPMGGQMDRTGIFPQQDTASSMLQPNAGNIGMRQPSMGSGNIGMREPSMTEGNIGMREPSMEDAFSSFDSGNVRDAMNYGSDITRGAMSYDSDTANSGDVRDRASYGSNGLYNADEVASMMDQSGYFFSDADRRLAQKYPEFGIYAIQCKREYAEATTPEAKALANANLEAMRKKLGSYTGGSDGSQYNLIPDDIDDRPTYDPSNLPDMPTWDPTGAGEMPEWDGAGSPAQPTWDPSSLQDRPTYDPTGLGDMPAYDPTGLGDMPTYDPTKDGERPTWDDAGNRTDLDAAIQKIRDLAPYDDKYNDQIQSLLQQILGRGDFSYDYQTDPVWQSYKKQYTREGQRAQADALAQASALTGGIPSSYATTAAQQAGNYYAAQMSDKIPELYQAAYDRWNSEGDRMLGNMNMLRGLANDDYGRYSDNYNRLMNNLDAERALYNDAYGRHRDDVSDWQNDRNFNYNQYLNQLDQWNNDRNFGYNQWRDQVGDWQNNRNFGYNQYLDALSQWNNDRNFDYNRYLDQLGQWNTDRNFDYGRYRDQVGDWRDNRNFDYDRYRDQVGDWRDSRNFDYDAYRDSTSDWQRQQDDEYDRRLQEAKLRASLGDYSGYDELYGTGGQLQALYDAMNVGGGYGGGGYGGGGNGGGDDADLYDGFPVNNADFLSLGEGPIGYDRAMQLVNEGKAVRYLEDGKWRFKKAEDVKPDTPLVTDYIRDRFSGF